MTGEEEDLTCLLGCLTSQVVTLNDLCSRETIGRSEAVDDCFLIWPYVTNTEGFFASWIDEAIFHLSRTACAYFPHFAE